MKKKSENKNLGKKIKKTGNKNSGTKVTKILEQKLQKFGNKIIKI
jgi:hypothetical protein